MSAAFAQHAGSGASSSVQPAVANGGHYCHLHIVVWFGVYVCRHCCIVPFLHGVHRTSFLEVCGQVLDGAISWAHTHHAPPPCSSSLAP
jgi:hypothetical protein